MMAKIYAVIDTNEYGERQIVGMCSSKSKAELAILCLNRFAWNGCYEVQEYNIDEILDEMKGNLEQELNSYKEAESLLNQINKL